MAAEDKNFKSWSEEDNEKLLQLYITNSNSQLANKLGRTKDAIRKQLNKLEIKRPLKSEIKKIEKKVKPVDFFAQVKKGAKKREQVLKLEAQEVKREAKRVKEKKWAETYLTGKKVIEIPKATHQMVAIRIDPQTVIEISASYNKKEREKIIKQYRDASIFKDEKAPHQSKGKPNKHKSKLR